MGIVFGGFYHERLKCIGGPNDGKQAYIGECDRVGDHVRVEQKKKFTIIEKFPLSDEEMAKEMTLQYSEYIIDCFNFSKDDKYYFLRPANWTNKKAMLHQFNK